MKINDLRITRPTLVLDKQKCLQNIENMSARAASADVVLRPHFKTHQSAVIGNWFRDFGTDSITVSSVEMAEYFSRAGWKDILVAFPFNPLELQALNRLSAEAGISILLDSAETLGKLGGLTSRVPFYIDIDTGYGRTGVRAEDISRIAVLIDLAGKNSMLEFSGFYCHAGHSYKASSRGELDAIHQKALSDLMKLKDAFSYTGAGVLYGDTPNCSMQDDFSGIDEITPGNFVFYDLFQHSIGSCKESDIAVAMACPVAAKYPDSGKLVIHGGAVHFSKEC